ncbi:uncharacterized protein ACIQIH_008382 isoform 2-T3 [Cyanocitta cristata]
MQDGWSCYVTMQHLDLCNNFLSGADGLNPWQSAPYQDVLALDAGGQEGASLRCCCRPRRAKGQRRAGLSWPPPESDQDLRYREQVWS